MNGVMEDTETRAQPRLSEGVQMGDKRVRNPLRARARESIVKNPGGASRRPFGLEQSRNTSPATNRSRSSPPGWRRRDGRRTACRSKAPLERRPVVGRAAHRLSLTADVAADRGHQADRGASVGARIDAARDDAREPRFGLARGGRRSLSPVRAPRSDQDGACNHCDGATRTRTRSRAGSARGERQGRPGDRA